MGMFGDALAAGSQSARGATLGRDITFYPTLLIGLGGTGAEVMLRVKRMLDERGFGDGLHRFLLLDTDRRTFQPQQGMPRLDLRRETHLIGVDRAKAYRERPHLHKHISARFPPDRLNESFVRNLERGLGASQIRSIGALAAALDADRIRQAITLAKEDLINMASVVEAADTMRGVSIGNNVTIYLVGSLAGGTGSGSFLDVSLIAQQACSDRNPHLIGMFALPDGFLAKVSKDPDQPTSVKANTYAALRELQYVLDAGTDVRSRDIHYDYGGFEVTLPASERLFKFCYLVTDRNSRGKLTELDDLYDLMARSIFQEVGSPFGTDAQSFQANVQVLNGITPCPETNRPRLFSTVSTASLVYPARRVANYWVLRMMESLVHDRLLGGVPALENIRQQVTAFLARHQLDERGPSDQILDSLLTDTADQATVGARRYGVPRTFGERFGNKAFAAEIERRRAAFVSDDLPAVRGLAQENLRRRLGGATLGTDPVGAALAEAVVVTVTTHGVRGLLTFLSSLLEEASAMREEVAREIDEWRRNGEPGFDQNLSGLRRDLVSISWLKAKTGSADERLRAQLVTAFNDYVEQRCRADARPAAMDLLDALVARTRAAHGEWATVSTELERLRAELATRASRLQTKDRSAVQRFVVDQEVTPPGYEHTYYESAKLPVDQAFGLVVSSVGSPEDLYRSLAGRSWPEIAQMLERPLAEHIEPALFGTDVLAYVDSSEDAAVKLVDKVNVLFEMCQPFWPAEPITADMRFAEFLGISAKPVLDADGAPAPPKALQAWSSGDHQFIVGHTPYEIVVSRRTYGARAHYLHPADDWRRAWETRIESSRGRYMLETHADYAQAPDLFPSDSAPVEAFALGLALGLITVRGNGYYVNLLVDGNTIRVLYASQWPTVHTLESAVAPPAKAGVIRFELNESRTLREAVKLADGRANALDALAGDARQITSIQTAVGEYLAAIGADAFRAQIDMYVEQVLKARMETDAVRADVYAREKAALEHYVRRIG